MPERMYVLRIEMVQDAITVLKPLYIHETFPVFLHLRRRAATLQRWTDLQPDYWDEPAAWLAVPGGPPGKPHFRPFTSRGGSDSSYWLGDNLAGSYQQSSLRGRVKDLYVDSNGLWRLPTLSNGEPDADQVSRQLLKAKPIPAWAVAVFLYRNRSFVEAPLAFTPGDVGWRDIHRVFQEQFRWTDRERQVLFTWDLPDPAPFEIWSNEGA